MHFDEAFRYLLSLGHETLAIKLGLKNTKLLLAALGNPQKSYSSVQIAGTNGKGSTAVVLDAICQAADIRTGLFTSPHLISITERIRIAGQEISTPQFAQHATKVWQAAQMLVDQGQIEALPTFFEQVTAIALLAFREANVELAILETGLGGRLDATTVAAAELVALTPIALDHEEYLGETIENIAAEKAAIVHSGVRAIVAAQSARALAVILQRCQQCAVRPSVNECTTKIESASPDGRMRVTFETPLGRYENVLPGLRGRHQITNVGVAIRLAESLRGSRFVVPQSAIIKGVEAAKHAGRLELWEESPPILFDGAHNPSGAKALREFLEEFVNASITLVFGAMRDKNLQEMAANLFPLASQLILTQPDNPRAASIESLERIASPIFKGNMRSAGSVKEAISIAKRVTPEDGLICFSGSLYLIGEVQALLKGARAGERAAAQGQNSRAGR
jgi:dihydrofolate synthase/folylpolyglutamate synthase